MAITFSGHKLHYTVDNEADINGSWAPGTHVYVSGSNRHYMMKSGGLYDQMNPDHLKSYFGPTMRQDSIVFTKSATVSGGVAVFQLTDDGLPAGNPIFPNGPNDDSVNVYVSDASSSYQMSHAWSNNNKTLTVTCNKMTTANILSGILGQTAANGASVRLTVWGR